MSDVNLALSPAASYLATTLAQQKPGLAIAPYRGVLTPVELDARPAELEALFTGAAIHDLGWLRRVAVRGEDRFRWLSGMVTNTVNDLPTNGGAWNLVLNAQGRIQGDLTVWRDGDDLELEIAADQYERLIGHLDRFIIMDDVELVPHETRTATGSAAGEFVPEEVVMGLTGPKTDAVLANLGLPSLAEPMTHASAQWNGLPVLLRRDYGVVAQHYSMRMPAHAALDLWNALRGAGAQPVGSAALEAFRVAEAIPAYGIDIVERDLPQETSQLRALHFNKGCYLGQEIVERIRSRGNVHRHLRALEMEGPVPTPGTEVLLEGAAAGHLTSVAEIPLATKPRIFGLGMIRAEAEVRNLPLDYNIGQEHGRAHLLAGSPTL